MLITGFPAMAEAKLHRYRSHTCGALRKSDVGAGVRLSGWVHRVRDHGGVLFIDLRDHYGVTQFEFYTVLFGFSRILGLTAHLVWSRALGKPIERPKSLTTHMLEQMVIGEEI